MRTLYARFRVLLHEAMKFGIVGALNAILDIALFNYFHFRLDVGPLTAKSMATCIAATSSYFMNRHWSFAHRARTGLRREYTLFFFLSAIGLGIALICLAITRYVLGYTSVLALNVGGNGVGLVLGTMWRFWSFKRWVFLPADHERPTPAEAAISTTV